METQQEALDAMKNLADDKISRSFHSPITNSPVPMMANIKTGTITADRIGIKASRSPLFAWHKERKEVVRIELIDFGKGMVQYCPESSPPHILQDFMADPLECFNFKKRYVKVALLGAKLGWSTKDF